MRACVEHLVVEGADIEVVAELFFGAVAQLEDFKLADLVGESLAGPCDVAIDLGLDGWSRRWLNGRGSSATICSRVQCCEWTPVSTTRRMARQMSPSRRP